MFSSARRHGIPLHSSSTAKQKHQQKQDEHEQKRKNKPPALSAPPTPSNAQSHAQAYAVARPATAAATTASFSRATGRPLAHVNSQYQRPMTASGATHLPSSVPQTFPTPAPSPLPSPLSVQVPLRLSMPRASASACATPSPLSSGLPSPTLPPLPSSHLSSQPPSTGQATLPHVRSPVINIGTGSPLVNHHHARKLSLSKDEFDYRVGGVGVGVVGRATHMRKFSTSSDVESAVTSPKSPNSRSSPLSPASCGSGSSMHEDVFSPGDRIGPGLTLQGEVLQRVFNENDSTRSDKEEPAAELEVVRRLGTGSYAIVYLVREVLHHPPPGVLDGLDKRNSDSDRNGNCDDLDELDLWESSDLDLDSESLELDGMRRAKENGSGNGDCNDTENVYYGKEYAVKVLSKAGMDKEALEAQLVEASIHQSIPIHPNIVTLHRALETPSFLLLVLEFVPGEDLYYFLEQARDHYEPEPLSSGSGSSSSEGEGDERRHTHKANTSVLSVNSVATMNTTRTPPTPSLLSTLNEKQLLGRRRLRLIASMFAQMCEAVQVCHDVGVYHRDIKPENFIVTDGWEDDGLRRRVVVKLTDFGLGTRDAASSDMDCGSAPYMSYECRNNCAPTYAPRAADVWSLGIVLTNMLYHVNPWTDTTQGVCPSFSAFLASPEQFFMQRFSGMVPAVASFLAQRVFCILPSDDPLDNTGRRASAREFGKWVRDLPYLMSREEPVGVPPALALAATDKNVSSLAFPPVRTSSPVPIRDEEKEEEPPVEKEVMPPMPPLSPTIPSSTLLAQSLAAVLAQQEAAAAAGSSSPAWRHRRGLSNASVGYALSSVPQSRRPASRQQSFSAERAPHLGLPGLGSAAGSRAATPLLRGRALGSAGPGARSRAPSSCETPAQMGMVGDLPVLDEGEGDVSNGSLRLELGREDADVLKENEQGRGVEQPGELSHVDEQERLREIEECSENTHEHDHHLEREQVPDHEQEHGQEHDHEHDGEEETSMSRSTSMVRRRKRGARRGKGQIIQQQQMEIARLQQQQEELTRQVQIMQEQLQKQQVHAQVQVLRSMSPTLPTASPKSATHVPQSPSGTGDALDSLASASEALARELSRTRNARSTPSSTLVHAHSYSHLQSSAHSHSYPSLSLSNSLQSSSATSVAAAGNQGTNLNHGSPTGSGSLSSNNVLSSVSVSAPPVSGALAPTRSISSTSLGTRDVSPSPSRTTSQTSSMAMRQQASPAEVLAFSGAGGPTPGAMFPYAFASPARTGSAGSAARRSQISSSSSAKISLHDTGNTLTPISGETSSPVPAPAIAKKTSKWKLSFGKGSSSAHSRTPLPQVQPETRTQTPAEVVVVDILAEGKNAKEGSKNSNVYAEDGADARQSTDASGGSAQHGASFPHNTTASRVKSVLTSLDADASAGTGAGKAQMTNANGSETWSRGRRPAGNHPWNASMLSADRWPNHDRERNASPNSTRTGRSGNLSTLSSSSSFVSHSSASSNNWRHSTLTTSSATSGWTRYSNSSMRSVSTVATSVSGASGTGSWRNGNASNASLASAERKPGHYHGPPSVASRKSDKSSLSGMPPPNVKIMTGVPWALDELPRQLHPNPSGDIFGAPPGARKQRARKPKDLPTINERPGHPHHTGGPAFNHGKAPAGKSPLSQRADAGRSSTSLPRNSSEESEERHGHVESEEQRHADGTPRKVQKGQINALAKMLSALRR